MDDSVAKFSRNYREVLRRYLVQPEEAVLNHAYELGRQAIGRGLGVLNVVRVHQEAVTWCLKSLDRPDRSNQPVKLAEVFLLESLSPFEATHRGFQDANLQLNQLIAILERRNEELGRVNRQLEVEVVERQLSEKALRRSEEDLRQLSNKVLNVQEEERTRISRELHDEVGQALTAINVNLAVLKKNELAASRSASRKISDTQDLLRQTMDTVHHFARELRPAMLDDLGLIPALRSYTKSFALRTGLRIRFSADPAAESLDRDQKTVLFRVIQESLTNVVRHAGAETVEIRVQKNKNGIRLAVKDDGKAFEVEQAITGRGNKRLGLVGMQERVRLVQGRFAIESKPGLGTTVLADIPLNLAAETYANDHRITG
jgi:signal transduction histidine kinase